MDDEELKNLILFCEEEKMQLQMLIDECVAESEYLMAHYHSKALNRINRKLQTLNTFDDKFYNEKYFIQIRIEGLEKRIATESSEYMKDYFLKEIEQTKEELNQLNQIQKPTALPKNRTVLDKSLKKLFKKEIKDLKLILKKADNLFLAFSYSKKVLEVSIPNIKKHKKKWIINEDRIQFLQKTGFIFTENETELVLKILGDKKEILMHLNIILSKIIFEIFFFKEFENQTYIQYTDCNAKDTF